MPPPLPAFLERAEATMRPTMMVRHVGFTDPIKINAEDFDPEVHSPLDGDAPETGPEAKAKPKTKKGKD